MLPDKVKRGWIFAGWLFAVLLVMMGLPATAVAATPARYLADRKLWVLETERTSYILGNNERGEIQHVYWGRKLARDDDFSAAHSGREHASFDTTGTMTNAEYSGWDGRMYSEPRLRRVRPG